MGSSLSPAHTSSTFVSPSTSHRDWEIDRDIDIDIDRKRENLFDNIVLTSALHLYLTHAHTHTHTPGPLEVFIISIDTGW